MRKPLAARDPFKIGLVAIGVVGLMGAGVVGLSTASFGTDTHTAVLEHTAGLRAGESVEVHGVPVGKVRKVELQGHDVLVTFTLDSGIDMGDQTTAAVKVATLLGTHYLEIDPAGSGDQDSIPLERTSVPYNLQDVLDQGHGKLEELDPVKLARALTTVSETFRAADGDIGPALTGVGALSDVVAKRSAQTGELLKAAQSVSDMLNADSADIVALMKDANLVISELTSRREAIHTLLVETKALADALTSIVDATNSDLAPALKDLDTVMTSLHQQDEKIQDVLSQMAPAVRYVANATGKGPYLNLWAQDPAIPADDQRCMTGDCR